MSLNSTTLAETEHSTYIDMLLNPDKLPQYQMDVSKAKTDIRDERHQSCHDSFPFSFLPSFIPYKKRSMNVKVMTNFSPIHKQGCFCKTRP